MTHLKIIVLSALFLTNGILLANPKTPTVDDISSSEIILTLLEAPPHVPKGLELLEPYAYHPSAGPGSPPLRPPVGSGGKVAGVETTGVNPEADGLAIGVDEKTTNQTLRFKGKTLLDSGHSIQGKLKIIGEIHVITSTGATGDVCIVYNGPHAGQPLARYYFVSVQPDIRAKVVASFISPALNDEVDIKFFHDAAHTAHDTADMIVENGGQRNMVILAGNGKAVIPNNFRTESANLSLLQDEAKAGTAALSAYEPPSVPISQARKYIEQQAKQENEKNDNEHENLIWRNSKSISGTLVGVGKITAITFGVESGDGGNWWSDDIQVFWAGGHSDWIATKGVLEMNITDGMLTIKSLEQADDDANCCPSTIQLTKFRIVDNRLVQSSKSVLGHKTYQTDVGQSADATETKPPAVAKDSRHSGLLPAACLADLVVIRVCNSAYLEFADKSQPDQAKSIREQKVPQAVEKQMQDMLKQNGATATSDYCAAPDTRGRYINYANGLFQFMAIQGAQETSKMDGCYVGMNGILPR